MGHNHRVIFHTLRYEGIFTPPSEAGIQPQYGVRYGVTLNPFFSPFGLPFKQPAWSYRSAVDLKTNQVKRMSTVRDSSTLPLPFKMGMPMRGGPISTAGNVLFIGATADNYLRAYNISSDGKLWEVRLPAVAGDDIQRSVIAGSNI